MEVVFRDEDAGISLIPKSQIPNPNPTTTFNRDVRTGDGCESDPGSEAAEEAD